MTILERYKRYLYPQHETRRVEPFMRGERDDVESNPEETREIFEQSGGTENRIMIYNLQEQVAVIDERTAFTARLLLILFGSLVLSTLSGIVILLISP